MKRLFKTLLAIGNKEVMKTIYKSIEGKEKIIDNK